MFTDDFDMNLSDISSNDALLDDVSSMDLSTSDIVFNNFGSSFDGFEDTYHMSFKGSFDNSDLKSFTTETNVTDSTISIETIEFNPNHSEPLSFNSDGNSHHAIENPLDSDQGHELSFKGGEHSVSERNAAITKAKHDIAAAKSDIDHQTHMIKSKTNMGVPHSEHDSALRAAQNRLNDAKRALNEAYNMKTKS